MRCSLICLCLAFAPLSVFADSFAYVSVSGEQKIAVYHLNDHTGALTHRLDTPTSGPPASVTLNPSQTLLFAAIRTSKATSSKPAGIASFHVDAKTGELKLIGRVGVGADPAYLKVDTTGKFLLSAYYRAGQVVVHRIGNDGTLSKEPLQIIPTDDKAHSIELDRRNKYAFVAHTGPNAIYQFKFDARSGKLTANDPPLFSTPANSGPRHIQLHPSKSLAYIDNEQGSSVTTYAVSVDGTLKALQTLTTLPDGFTENNSNSHIEMTPDARFVYVANRGHDSIAGFAADPKTGLLEALGQTKTEKTPRSFNISPSGKYLLAAGQASGKVAVYEISPKTGALDRRNTYDVGSRPWWVRVVRF